MYVSVFPLGYMPICKTAATNHKFNFLNDILLQKLFKHNKVNNFDYTKNFHSVGIYMERNQNPSFK